MRKTAPFNPREERARWGARRRRWILLLSAASAACLLIGALGAVLVVVPAVSPAAGAATADFLRSIIGPEPVAYLESLSFWMHDSLQRVGTLGRNTGPDVTWSGGTGPAPENLVAPTVSPASPTPDASSSFRAAPLPTRLPEPTPSPALDVVTAAPQLGWQAYGPTHTGVPLLARTLVMVDPDRSYAGVALVRMDLSQLQLHVMAGSIEPAHPPGIDARIPGLGMIPPPDQQSLIAAFNGGFKAVHGHYGMMVDGMTLLQPEDGMATIALYQDGTVRLGAWGREIVPSPDLVAFRQNCPPLIENGQINPGLATNERKAWGITNNTDVTWRTGVGLTPDRRYLIYAVGNGTTLQFLAEALQRAGASDALQLDINQYYSHFVTYAVSPEDGRLEAQPLLAQMIDIHELYLTPNVRDFFYLTEK